MAPIYRAATASRKRYNLLMRTLLALLPLLGCLPPSYAEPVRTKHVIAELVAERDRLEAGSAAPESNWIGLRLEMEPHWHTYWRFPGDSGLPTEVKWSLPKGWKVTGPYWPHPQRIFVPPLVNYGYEGVALLGYRLEIPAGEKPGRKAIAGKASWLVCKEVCIPEDAQLSLSVEVGRPGKAGVLSREFEKVRAQQPVPAPQGSSVNIIYDGKLLGLELKGFGKFGKVDFLPLVPQIVKGEAPPAMKGNAHWLQMADPFDRAATTLPGVLLLTDGSDTRAHEISPALPPAGEASPSAAAPEASPSAPILIILAFLGGLILNLMPCVFPVLGIKVMALVKQGQGHSHHARRHGHAYALGVLACFLALAGALLVLRGLGQSVGWGFQLQQPLFVTLLILLFSFVAADLAGFIHWSGRWMGAGGSLANKEGAAGSFFTGILAVVVATPCTAPFMGTAIGAAIAEPAWVVMLVFSALGLGLAAPFVVFCYQPALLKRLPRPGAWMERLKEFFAFPMAGTVLWLLWVLTLQIGADGALKVELGLLLLMLSVWARRRFASGPAQALGWALFLAGVLAAVGGAASSPLAGTSAQPQGSWKPYSEDALSEALAAGKPVFVDFTAAWCLTCQVNKKLVLDRSAAQDFFRERGVLLLLADWTNRDPVITKALERHGRIGVPLYLAYKAGSREPVILPQVLTDGLVREAFKAP